MFIFSLRPLSCSGGGGRIGCIQNCLIFGGTHLMDYLLAGYCEQIILTIDRLCGNHVYRLLGLSTLQSALI